MGHIRRVTGKQQLVDRVGHFGGQVFDLAHRNFVDAGFLFYIGRVGVLRHDAVFVVGQRHNVPIAAEGADRLDEVRREGMLHQCLAGLAVDDLAAVIA